MSGWYILDGHKPKAVRSITQWAQWMQTASRHVDETTIGPLWISTVFLGLDHGYFEGPPILFETMIFGFDENDSYQTRCATWDEAVRMHSLAKDIAQTLVDAANVTLAAFGEQMSVRFKLTHLPPDGEDQAGEKSTC